MSRGTQNTVPSPPGCPFGYGTQAILTSQGSFETKEIFGICNVMFINDDMFGSRYECNQDGQVELEMFSDINCTTPIQGVAKQNVNDQFTNQTVCSPSDPNYDQSCGYVSMYEWTPTSQSGTCGDYKDPLNTNKTLMTVVYDSWSWPIDSCIEDSYVSGMYEHNTLRSCDADHYGVVIESNSYTADTCSAQNILPIEPMEIRTHLSTQQGDLDKYSNTYKCRKFVECSSNYPDLVNATSFGSTTNPNTPRSTDPKGGQSTNSNRGQTTDKNRGQTTDSKRGQTTNKNRGQTTDPNKGSSTSSPSLSPSLSPTTRPPYTPKVTNIQPQTTNSKTSTKFDGAKVINESKSDIVHQFIFANIFIAIIAVIIV